MTFFEKIHAAKILKYVLLIALNVKGLIRRAYLLRLEMAE